MTQPDLKLQTSQGEITVIPVQNSAIRSSDPKAIEKVRAKIQNAEARQAHMKGVNKIVKSKAAWVHPSAEGDRPHGEIWAIRASGGDVV